MKVEYFPGADTLSIVFASGPFVPEGEDTTDPNVTLLYDDENRIAEILIEHASERIDLAELRRKVSFEEVHDLTGPRAA